MADYFTQFSCILPMPGLVQKDAAMAEYLRRGECWDDWLHADDDAVEPDGAQFKAEADISEDGSHQIWLHADEMFNSGDVTEFVLWCAEAFNMHGMWGFQWAETCSKPRIEAFCGGAVAINLTERSHKWLHTSGWLDEQGVEQRVTFDEPIVITE